MRRSGAAREKLMIHRPSVIAVLHRVWRDDKTLRISSAQRDRLDAHQWIKANRKLIAIREWRIL
jgi:hypothetical protein